jgi:hypothetical protein
MIKLKKIANIIFIITPFIIIGYIIYSIMVISSIKKNPEITTGLIVGYKENRNRICLIYEYTVDNKKYTKKDIEEYYNLDFNLVKNKKIPVVYNKNNHNWSYLLMTPQDFGQLGKPFPDSLKWLLKLPK